MTPHRSPQRPARGFTLIEAMIAMAIVMIGMLGLYSGYSVALNANSRGRKVSQATEVAQAVIHELTVAAWDSAALKDTNPGNNGDVDDRARIFETASPATLADHQLNLAGSTLTYGTDLLVLNAFSASEKLDYDGNGQPDFEVYWNVADCDVSSNTEPWTLACSSPSEVDLKQIGVIVRWNDQGTWRMVASQTERATAKSAGL